MCAVALDWSADGRLLTIHDTVDRSHGRSSQPPRNFVLEHSSNVMNDRDRTDQTSRDRPREGSESEDKLRTGKEAGGKTASNSKSKTKGSKGSGTPGSGDRAQSDETGRCYMWLS